MLGGYQILDLRNIDLSRATTESSITDVEVLKQLSQIADYIQKTYDFSKPLHNQLKPLLIRYRDKKVGEKHEVALYGNIEVINVYYKFRIIAINEGEQLTINVEFEEKTDEYDNKYWDIKTATILLTTNVDIKGDLTANSIIENMTGYVAFIPTQEKLTIKNVYTSVVKNGNKLTFVSALNITRTDEISGSIDVVWFGVPNDIFSKLYPTSIGSYNMLSYTNGNFIASDDSVVNLSLMIEKRNVGNNIICYIQGGTIGNLPLNKKVYIRIEQTFLLSGNLISNE